MISNSVLVSVAFIAIPLIIVIIAALGIVALGMYLLVRKERGISRTILVSAFMVIIAFFIILRLVLNASSPSTARSGSATPTPIPAPASPPTIAPQLHVAGNQILGSNNMPVRLLGVNRSGTEYQCLHSGIFDGPSDETSILAMLSWHINAVRIPLNEDCWLNINLGTSVFGGIVYQNAIVSYVNLLIANGITPILDLHWSASGNQTATSLEPLPDRDHSLTFWSQVATTFRGNDAVIFDLFNEPYPDNNLKTTNAWQCWRDGTNAATCPAGTAGLSYAAAGMQELVTTIRNTGATNIIMLGGIQYASTLDQWMRYKPVDPRNALVASWHFYNDSQCNQSACWTREVLPVMEHYPLIAGEIGENDAGSAFITQVMNFLDAPGKNLRPQSYLAWVWNTDQTVYDLITDYANGTPTIPYGWAFRNHLAFQHLPPS
jgi:endoglucanase